MSAPIAVNVGIQPSQLWSGRQSSISTLLLMNTDVLNTVMVGSSLQSLVVPIAPNGSLSVDPTENWYVVGAVQGTAPVVVVPNGQANFLGLTQGLGSLAIPSIHSPNFNPVSGVGWSINQDGTASFTEVTIVVVASGAAVLIYFPVAGQGNLIGSWAASAFVDQYGNVVPQGINVNGGVISAVTLNQPQVVGGTIFQTLLNAVQIANSQITQGTSYEQTITFDTGGGLCIGYTTTVTNVSHTANGTYNDALPAGVNTINNAFCWAAGAGGDGGNTSEGGNGGGAGEFAGENSYTITSPPVGGIVTVTSVVGNGGNSSTTGAGHGGDGQDTFIDGGGVLANGGNGDGTPGTGSTNTLHFDGGTGGTTSGNGGGASGGNSGNPTAKGNNGLSSTSNTHAGAPVPQTNSGTGGAGGDAAGNASNGGSPGAGGGGAGQGSGAPATLTKTYEALYTASYYGPDATGTPNGLRSTSTMYQGGETAGGGAFNGNQRSVMVFDSNQIASDFAGFTPTQLTLKLVNQHSWFNSGMTVEIDVGASPHKYPTSGGVPGTWLGNQNQFAITTIAEGSTHSYNLGAACAGFFTNNQTNFLGLGAFVAANNPYNLNYYGYFAGGHSVNVEITITGTKTVAGSTTSGQGSDGKVSFSYASSQAIVFGLSAVAGADASGNNFAAGYTGPANVFDPNASPAQVEAWHSATLANGWAKQGFARYKLIGYNTMLIEFQINDNAATSGTFFTMPAGYSASQGQFGILGIFNNVAGAPKNSVGIVQIGTGAGASFSVLDWAKQSLQYVGNLVVSLD